MALDDAGAVVVDFLHGFVGDVDEGDVVEVPLWIIDALEVR